LLFGGCAQETPREQHRPPLFSLTAFGTMKAEKKKPPKSFLVATFSFASGVKQTLYPQTWRAQECLSLASPQH
jgi:hypothetical protein